MNFNSFFGALRSKTIWFNLITGTLAILATPEIVQVVPVEWLPKIAIINAIGNLILRFLTNGSLAGKIK